MAESSRRNIHVLGAFMKIRSVLAIAIVCFSASTAMYARTGDTPSLTYVGFAKEKTVKFSLRNDSATAMELKVGDNVMTIDAGKTVTLNLPVGTRILTNAATTTHQAGSVITEVSRVLNNSTVAVR
jgi:hypothetical protein